MKAFLFTLFIFTGFCSQAQKIDSIYFHLYTDSLKKGVYNYINVDGKLGNGQYLPLGTDKIKFSSSTGTWDGNSLIIEPGFTGDSVLVKADFKENTSLSKSITIYLKKNLSTIPLKTEKEIMDELKKNKKNG